MKLTKQDLMRLPKERLAEIIVEMQEPLTLTTPEKDVPHFIPFQNTRPFCYEPGGHCTNPQMDCINCPKHNSTIPYVYTGPHIDTYISGDATGTSTAKLSATDGKEHNPSFIE